MVTPHYLLSPQFLGSQLGSQVGSQVSRLCRFSSRLSSQLSSWLTFAGRVPMRRCSLLMAMFGAASFLIAAPAQAHHAMGGRSPVTWLEGFLSGLAHPVIGLDHAAFVVAVGLLAATQPRGVIIPIAFLLLALVGTGLHIMAMNLPLVEFMIAASVVAAGLLLALKSPLASGTRRQVAWISGLAAVAGLFHGYAYGEAIVGALPSSIAAYLVGFTVMQCFIATGAFWMGQQTLKRSTHLFPPALRQVGFVICGIGAAFLATVLSDSLLAS